MMDQLSVYLGLHALFALAVAGSAVYRLAVRKEGLVEWGNEALWIGLVFIIALTGAMVAMPGTP